MNSLRLLRTLKHLRWEQLVYRPLRIAQYRLYGTLPRLTSHWTNGNGKAPDVAAETMDTFRAAVEKSFAHLRTPLTAQESLLADLAENRFTFLNRKLTLDPIDWNRRYESHLWNYQLHYFSFTLPCAWAFVERKDEQSWRICQSLIESWIRQARIGRSDGWDAYPISLRVVNWMYAYTLVMDICDDRAFLERWRSNIYQQLEFLSRRLEFHLLANHLLKNVKALLIGGLFFGERRWTAQGEQLLWREFGEQVLRDGGHYERAPMYHAQTLADFLESYALLKSFHRLSSNAGEIEARLRAMAGFLKAMSYRDGSLALFNDSANTEETRPWPILETAKRILGEDPADFPRAFPHAGYYLWVSPDEREKIIVDAGAVSVEYNTAHAHCDLLSYELWLDGRPFVVDSGVHGYGGDAFREYCRSTRAHNTVMFDGREQSEVWGTFRMARRAEPLGAGEIGNNGRALWSFRGKYRPYYDERMIHEREIRRTAAGEWVFQDKATFSGARRATSFIHLHPDVKAKRVDEKSLAVECQASTSEENLKVIVQPFEAEAVRIVCGEKAPVQGWYFPDFGVARPSATIIFEHRIEAESKIFGYTIKRIASG
jgi:uncharacterized heparinase superfamily protein